MTNEILRKFQKFPYLSQDGKGLQAEVLVKYFNPYGWPTWIITEAEYDEENCDWIMYGYCNLGYGYEFGPVSFNELSSIRVNVWGHKMPLERDIYLKKHCKVIDLISPEDLM